MKPKEASIYRSEHFHSAGSVHFLTGVDTASPVPIEIANKTSSNIYIFILNSPY
jgi:hypothetical protein